MAVTVFVAYTLADDQDTVQNELNNWSELLKTFVYTQIYE